MHDKSTTPSQKFAILYGIWACYYVGGEVAIRAAAEEFLAEAERHDDTAALCLSHRTLGTTLVTMGDFVGGRWHLERARALYDPVNHARFRYQYGINRMLAAPHLPPLLHTIILEYVDERVAGLYGHSKLQLRRFTARRAEQAKGMRMERSALWHEAPPELTRPHFRSFLVASRHNNQHHYNNRSGTK